MPTSVLCSALEGGGISIEGGGLRSLVCVVGEVGGLGEEPNPKRSSRI